MKCLYLILTLITVLSSLAEDVNIYKKDFDETGKAYYFTPNPDYKGYKIAVGEKCTKVVVAMQDASGNLQQPSKANPLSAHNGVYVAEIVRYPGGKCALPDTQKYGKEIIKSSPDDLLNYYNGKKGPLAKYEFKTENKSEGGFVGNLFSNKWVLIAVGAGLLVIIGGIAFIIIRNKRNENDDYNKKFISNDQDMKKNSEPYIGLTNSSEGSNKDENFTFGQPFNPSISNPVNNYNSNWMNSSTSSLNNNSNSSNNGSTSNLLAPPSEPKRVTSITFEEQENYSNMMKKHMEEERLQKEMRSPTAGGRPKIPDEYERFKTFKVVRKFTPQRNDELVVEIGNLVKMIKSFEDGWTLCYNIDTRKEGYIPKNKLASLDQPTKPQPAKPQQLYRNDTSSSISSGYNSKPVMHNNSQSSSYSNGSYNRNRGQRPVNSRSNTQSSVGSRSNTQTSVSSRNNSNASRTGAAYRNASNSPKNTPNKYYRKQSDGYPSNGYNENYINNSYGRNQKRYDM